MSFKSEEQTGKMWASIPLKLTVQDGELCRGLEGEEVCHSEVKKLCSNVGFEQRCIVRREEHSQKVKLGLYFNIAISILGFGNTVKELNCDGNWRCDDNSDEERIGFHFSLPFVLFFVKSPTQ